MKAATVVPGRPESAGISDLPDPSPDAGELLVDGLLEQTDDGRFALPGES